ncbi:hypothetical protein EYR41_004298 [Orbilia oligospora]|uniref:Protein kinase domain-containing protein n=1 Tax=Orbilia oligospora TaxID=2813651 RepID=A0A8H2E8G7_ORBOL|nr:hypothetical protein EYR41_004298 [Orbilia oligospora]
MLAAVVSANTISESCTRATGLIQSCTPNERAKSSEDAIGCIEDAAKVLPQTDIHVLEAFRAHFALSNVGSIPKNATSAIQPDAHYPYGDVLDSIDCNDIHTSLQGPLVLSNWDSVAHFFCFDGNTDEITKACYDYIFDSDPTKASPFGALLGFCSKNYSPSSKGPKTVQTSDPQTTLFPISTLSSIQTSTLPASTDIPPRALAPPTITTIPACSRRYLDDLTEWPGIKNDVKGLLDPLLSHKSRRYQTFADEFSDEAVGRDWCVNEKAVLRLGAHVYEGPTRRILQELFSIESNFGDHEKVFTIGDPDRVFYIYDEADVGSTAKFFLQWKSPWELTMPKDIKQHFNESKNNLDDQIIKAISKIYGYMTFNNLMFGALCNHETLFLFCRTGGAGLEVLPPFLYADEGTGSILAALVYICHYVVKHESFHYSPVQRGPPGTRVFTLEDLDVEGTWGDDIKVPWADMSLVLSGTGRKNFAAVMSGEVRPQRRVKFRYNTTAFFKVYDIIIHSKIDLANAEIQVHTRLKSLQGEHIPRLYAAGVSWKFLKFLVLEDCGETASEENVDESFWVKARKAIIAFHKSGVIHGDIRLDNFAISRTVHV